MKTQMTIRIDIVPVPKPRMVRSDKWKKRPVVLSYWAYKNELLLKCNVAKVEIGEILSVDFHLPMPVSWSKTKKQEMNGKPHEQTPDLDNLIKGLQDCLLKQDKKIHRIIAAKYWGECGLIVFN